MIFKRMMDITGAIVGFLVFGPVMIAVAIMVARRLGRPVLFRQKRVGKDGRIFELVKFRTMRDAVDAEGRPLSDAERLTPFGARLRATSLDELPEFWNILRGEMSLVGPRPLLVEYLPFYTPREAIRHQMHPGITGLAQVRGRNALSWRQKFRYDAFYVEHWNLALDIRILLETLAAVARRRGISASGEATMIRLDKERSGT